MARRPDPVDDDDDVPAPPRKKARPAADDGVEAAPTQDEGEKKLSDLSDKALVKRLARYTEEFYLLAADQSQAAMTRRIELTRAMRAIQEVRDAREPIVEIQVPRSVTGEPFIVGPATFNPGVYHVRASVAQYLLWMIGENQRVELNRLKSNGRTIDLGTIGSRARMAAIARDDGNSDYGGRGS